nr:hypothetical protein [Tanacetum cinerariifolium]
MPQSDINCLRLNQSPNSVNIPNISRSNVTVENSSINISLTTSIIASSSDPVLVDNSSSNISLTSSISAISSDSINVSTANVNDRPRVWVLDVEPSLKPSKGRIFVSIDQAYDFYKHYGILGGFDIKLGTEKNYHDTEGKGKGEVNSVANEKGKGKVTNDGFSVNGNNDDVSNVSKPDDVSNVSKPDDGFSGTGKNIDVAVRSLFRKNTSYKTGCLAWMMIRKVDGDMFEVHGFVKEHNHPLVSQDDMQFMMSSKELGMTATDCKNFRRDLNLFIGDQDAQMVVEKLENLEKRYRMVFVPFTGIDNHNRSVTFGAGLLSDEIVRSYKWLLQSFKKAFVADPQVVITDQDPSMKQAIEVEFPNGRHRLCMWHIMQKLVTKTGSFKDNLDLYRLELSDLLEKAKAKVLVLMCVNKKDTFCLMLGVTEPESVVIKVPRHSTNKGTGSHTRWKNMDELIQNEAESSKKRRTCFVCGRAEGHNCRTCPSKDAINVAAANKRTKCGTRSSALNYKE